ncbi:MAG: FecR family protein [Treponema sp.]|nr:FecR family protein [Treponema sp.]
MQKKITIPFISGVLFIFMISGIAAQNAATQTNNPSAVIRDIAGTVEIRLAGSEVWKPAAKGQSISGDTTISTGFKSSALLALGDSLVTIRPLTRLTLKELSMSADTEKVQVNLQTGRVRAEVKAPAGARAQFTVQSPSATASVRGTVFEFDTQNLWVSEGTVAFSGAANIPVLVDAGRFSYSDERTGRASSPDTNATDLAPDLPIASDASTQGQTVNNPGTTGSRESSGRIHITVGF